jgi:hypothetical protein
MQPRAEDHLDERTLPLPGAEEDGQAEEASGAAQAVGVHRAGMPEGAEEGEETDGRRPDAAALLRESRALLDAAGRSIDETQRRLLESRDRVAAMDADVARLEEAAEALRRRAPGADAAE